MRLSLLGAALALTISCNPAPSQEDYDSTRGGRIDVFFNEPGTRNSNLWEPDAEDVLVELINSADATIDIAVMGFTRDRVYNALIAAHDKGIAVRFVGDAGHLYNAGYQAVIQRHIPMSTGNLVHIMHDKFVIVDDRFVFTSTANFSPTDLRRNSNNFTMMDSPNVAADFKEEFEQMFHGSYGHQKVEIDNGRAYMLGKDCDPTIPPDEMDAYLQRPENFECALVEVWFSPNEDAMGRILEYVDGAQDSLRFTIFAFTKDQVGSAFIRKQEEWALLNEQDAGDQNPDGPFADRTVAGVIDQSQLHSNGQYHEVYRLLGAGIPARMDGIDNSRQPGDYQAGGGRLHSKTMIMDAWGDKPVVVTGSFNWSSSATVSNDEFLLIIRGPRVAQEFDGYFDRLWDQGRHIGGDNMDDDDLSPGDVVINEVMWYGVNAADDDGFDEFIELRNTTDKRIDLDLWSIANPDDFVVGLPPGSYIEPQGLFTILDHTLEVYVDGSPQDGLSAYANGDLTVNAFNDNRQARLYLKDGNFELFVKDPRGNIMDSAGDGGPAFVGGPSGSVVRSMERNASPGDGTVDSSWHQCSLSEGGANVNEGFRNTIIATPGEDNSP